MFARLLFCDLAYRSSISPLMAHVTLDELQQLATRALERAGASTSAAEVTARALVYAQAQGLDSHGMSRVPQYASHLRNARVEGHASPRITNERGGALLVDAADGLAFPACELAINEAIARAKATALRLRVSPTAITSAPRPITWKQSAALPWWASRFPTRP